MANFAAEHAAACADAEGGGASQATRGSFTKVIYGLPEVPLLPE